MLPPTPEAFVLLVVLLPGVWLAGWLLADRLTLSRSVALVLAPALALSMWLLAVHVTSLAARSFWVGITLGTGTVAAAGVFFWLRSRGHVEPPPFRSFIASERSMLLAAIAVTIYLAPTALGWAFHDELAMTGHFSIASEIENGIYPPRHLTFPEIELRYHYGFDLLVASIASMLRLRVDNAIDLVTLAAWGYSWCLAWVAGERLVGRSWGPVTAAVVLFGGGIPFFSSAPSFAKVQTPIFRLLGLGAVGPDDLSPPLVSNFFQHPWTLGIPLALATIVVVSMRDAPDRRARWAAMAILLLALSFCQTVLFLCLAGALFVSEWLAHYKTDRRSALAAVILLGVTVALATRLHGFFAPLPEGSEMMIEPRSEPLGGSLAGWASWHAQSFGLLLPFGVVGLTLLAGERLLVALLVVGSLLVLNLLRYRLSWDIVKFAGVASLALSFGVAATLRRVWTLRAHSLWNGAAAIAFLGVVATGSIFPFVVGFYGEGNPFARSPLELPNDDKLAVDWLRRRILPGEVVYRRGWAGRGYAQWGGLPQLVYDRDTTMFGLPRRLLEGREELLQRLTSDPQALLQTRVRWVAVDTSSDPIARALDHPGDQQLIARAQFGTVTIFEVNGVVPAPRSD
jgi:hypothetical protein